MRECSIFRKHILSYLGIKEHYISNLNSSEKNYRRERAREGEKVNLIKC